MHAFLTSYVHMDDFSKLRDMIENFIDVIGKVCVKLGIIYLQTGGGVSNMNQGVQKTGRARSTTVPILGQPQSHSPKKSRATRAMA